MHNKNCIKSFTRKQAVFAKILYVPFTFENATVRIVVNTKTHCCAVLLAGWNENA